MCCADRISRLFCSETMFISMVMLAVFVIPNNGSPLFEPTTPWEIIFSKTVLAIGICALIGLFGLQSFTPFISIVLLVASTIFLPARIQDIATMYGIDLHLDLYHK